MFYIVGVKVDFQTFTTMLFKKIERNGKLMTINEVEDTEFEAGDTVVVTLNDGFEYLSDNNQREFKLKTASFGGHMLMYEMSLESIQCEKYSNVLFTYDNGCYICMDHGSEDMNTKITKTEIENFTKFMDEYSKMTDWVLDIMWYEKRF